MVYAAADAPDQTNLDSSLCHVRTGEGAGRNPARGHEEQDRVEGERWTFAVQHPPELLVRMLPCRRLTGTWWRSGQDKGSR